MKILIVEDDFASRELLKISIAKEGYECIAAEDGEMGLKLFQSYNPDIVISDIRMPRMDGMTLLGEIRKLSKSVIIIIVTGHGNETLALQSLQLGANNYIKKPLDLHDLKTQLKRYKNFIESKVQERNISELVVSGEIELEFDSDLNLGPIVAKYLVHKTGTFFEEKSQIGLELGLSEIITNSIEHGNLEITSKEKALALNENTLNNLYNERLGNKNLSQRKVKVSYSRNTEYCEWTIEDEGQGFNLHDVPHSTDHPLLNELHGRGIFISKMQFDEIEYLGKGNKVRLKKAKKK